MPRFALFAALFLAAPAAAQTPDRYAAADAAALAEFGRQELVGLAVAVIDDGKVAWAKGYGYEDREARTPADPGRTQFRWASISKAVTAVAALQLAAAGRFDLDADVRQYVPEFPDKGAKITPRHLLCHQGGIVHYANGRVVRAARDFSDPRPFADPVAALDYFKDSPLLHPPGQKYAYTTHGYVLLGAAVERAGKRRFAEQVRDRIAGPLGMADFRPDYAWENIPRRAAGYTRTDGNVARRPDDKSADVGWKLAGGGFTSPVTDLARFGAGLLRRELVSEATERAMWTVNRPKDPTGAKPYGYGFFVVEAAGRPKLVGHSGSQEKTRTQLILDPAGKRGVAVMTNSEWGNAERIAAVVLAAMK